MLDGIPTAADRPDAEFSELVASSLSAYRSDPTDGPAGTYADRQDVAREVVRRLRDQGEPVVARRSQFGGYVIERADWRAVSNATLVPERPSSGGGERRAYAYRG